MIFTKTKITTHVYTYAHTQTYKATVFNTENQTRYSQHKEASVKGKWCGWVPTLSLVSLFQPFRPSSNIAVL